MRNLYLNIAIYSIAHALVDASCAVLILFAINAGENLFFYAILYNILAFGLQLPFGWICDFLKKPVMASAFGCMLIIFSILSVNLPLFATVLAGVGNALFHTGGGTIALNVHPKKALTPGIFVAPGGIGLSIGILLAKFKIYNQWPFIILLLLACLAFIIIKNPKIEYKTSKIKLFDLIKLIILLIMITVAIRSMVGLSINFPWKSNLIFALILALSIALGKVTGGLLADRIDFLKVAVCSLFISAPLLAFGSHYLSFGLSGIFLFNFTMPITLVAISNLLPGRPGFSFGLASFALILGAFPTFFRYKEIISQSTILGLLVLFSSIILFIALMLYNKVITKGNDTSNTD